MESNRLLLARFYNFQNHASDPTLNVELCVTQNSGSEILNDDLMKAKEEGQTHRNGAWGSEQLQTQPYLGVQNVLSLHSAVSRQEHTPQT